MSRKERAARRKDALSPLSKNYFEDENNMISGHQLSDVPPGNNGDNDDDEEFSRALNQDFMSEPEDGGKSLTPMAK